MLHITARRKGHIAYRILQYLIGKDGMSVGFDMKRTILNRTEHVRGTSQDGLTFSKQILAGVMNEVLGGPELTLDSIDPRDPTLSGEIAWDILRNVIYEDGVGKHLKKRSYGEILKYLRRGCVGGEEELANITEEELAQFFRDITFDITMVNLA